MAAVAESAPAADEKRPDPSKAESYTEKVSVRRFESGKLAPNLVKDVPAFRYEKDGVLKLYTKDRIAGVPTVGSEITDEKGRTFIVEKVVDVSPSNYHISTMKIK